MGRLAMTGIPALQLLDWRRTVADMYREFREASDRGTAVRRFRERRDGLFRHHPQSPLAAEQRAAFTALRYFDFDPAYRVLGTVEPADEAVFDIPAGDDGIARIVRFGRVRFRLQGSELVLSLFWIAGYGGGLFLPFRDTTNGGQTYGGGRYLLDTIKHADLGGDAGGLVLDFNLAYNPSCAYNDRWVCPLSPPENRLGVAIPAGEMAFR